MPAMDRRRDFGDTELRGHLFRRQSRSEKIHDLALTSGQRSISLLQGGGIALLPEPCRVALERLLDYIHQFLWSKGLGEKFHSA
jgi:hypothetical protein